MKNLSIGPDKVYSRLHTTGTREFHTKTARVTSGDVHAPDPTQRRVGWHQLSGQSIADLGICTATVRAHELTMTSFPAPLGVDVAYYVAV